MRSALAALKLSDAEIAERAGVSQRTVRRWRKTGRMSPSSKRALSEVLRTQATKLETFAEALEDS